jgi:hypothetical protein
LWRPGERQNGWPRAAWLGEAPPAGVPRFRPAADGAAEAGRDDFRTSVLAPPWRSRGGVASRCDRRCEKGDAGGGRTTPLEWPGGASCALAAWGLFRGCQGVGRPLLGSCLILGPRTGQPTRQDGRSLGGLTREGLPRHSRWPARGWPGRLRRGCPGPGPPRLPSTGAIDACAGGGQNRGRRLAWPCRARSRWGGRGRRLGGQIRVPRRCHKTPGTGCRQGTEPTGLASTRGPGPHLGTCHHVRKRKSGDTGGWCGGPPATPRAWRMGSE